MLKNISFFTFYLRYIHFDVKLLIFLPLYWLIGGVYSILFNFHQAFLAVLY